MNKDYLPIGSVVLLKGATKKLMITGFYVTADGHDEIFDYSACLYPEGIVTSDQNGVFNHEQIDKVIYTGYSDEEEKSFKEKLYEAINNKNKNEKTNNSDKKDNNNNNNPLPIFDIKENV